MASREERRKELELIHLDSFLRLSGRTAEIEPSERPDFLLAASEGRYGVEVTYLFKRESAKGSWAKREERIRIQFLNDLARHYYAVNQKPLRIQAVLPAFPSRAALSAIAHELRSQTNELEPGATTEILVDCKSETYQIFARVLPDEFSGYSHWGSVSDTVGWVETIDPELLAEKIRTKAAKLGEYRKSVQRVLLLIVA